MTEPFYAINLDAYPCECGHGGAQHYNAEDDDEETASGIIVKRARCHGMDTRVSGYSLELHICGCKGYREKK